jgi:hypothetical protein
VFAFSPHGGHPYDVDIILVPTFFVNALLLVRASTELGGAAAAVSRRAEWWKWSMAGYAAVASGILWAIQPWGGHTAVRGVSAAACARPPTGQRTSPPSLLGGT